MGSGGGENRELVSKQSGLEFGQNPEKSVQGQQGERVRSFGGKKGVFPP